MLFCNKRTSVGPETNYINVSHYSMVYKRQLTLLTESIIFVGRGGVIGVVSLSQILLQIRRLNISNKGRLIINNGSFYNFFLADFLDIRYMVVKGNYAKKSCPSSPEAGSEPEPEPNKISP